MIPILAFLPCSSNLSNGIKLILSLSCGTLAVCVLARGGK
jgi:hypothetical protein